ncbi:MAG: nucleotide exchange factor GrpE [Phycisphaerales bacterium JB063]
MADNDSKTDNEDFYEIDPEGPDALDLLKAAEADAAEAAEEAAAVDGAADSAGAAGTLEQVTAERDALQAQLLRVSADYQNFARRSQQNIASAAEQTQMSMARALVPVLDHFDRALESAAQQEHDAESGATPSGDLLRGVTMVKEELLNTLGRFGIERLEVTIGDEFDPVRHEALMRQPAEGVASNHITMLMLPGYVLGDKVVRPAQVGVAE